MYQSIQDINKLDLALTSVCNAKCVDCARWWMDTTTQYHNPKDTHANHHWPIEELKSHLDHLTDIRSVLICGNAGDPFAHPQLADICEWMSERWGESLREISIDTNGSLGNKDTWKRLAVIKQIDIRFAVDGLSETNHIYRRGVPWHRVVHNIELFHSMGGDAVFKTIDFPWNEPDRPYIKQWADKLEWKWILEDRWSPELDNFIMKQHKDNAEIHDWPTHGSEAPMNKDNTPWYELVHRAVESWQRDGGRIDPECKSDGDWIYINHDHTVWPCCYWANSRYTQQSENRLHLEQYLKDQPKHWNSLDHNSLIDIIANPVLQGIEKLWQGTSLETTSMLCISKCGKCGDSKNA